MLLCELFIGNLQAIGANSLILHNHTSRNYYSFTIGYWNDNFLFDREVNKLFNKDIFQTKDDFITSSFWLRVSKQQKYSSWFLDSYLNIATNKKSNFRTDFLSFVLSKEIQSKYGFVRIGGGVIFSGNFGGNKIQNYYHNILSINEVVLPYLDETYSGLYINSLLKVIVFEYSSFKMKVITSGSISTGGGLNLVKLGVEGNIPVIEEQLLLNIHLGYKNYFSINKSFDSFLGKGIVWGIFSTIKISRSIQASLWITGNQYGNQNQNHFGISFSFLSQKIIPIYFDSIDFP